MHELLEKSREIYNEAIALHNPYAVVAAISGGNDSAAAFHVARAIGVKIDYIIHIRTGTGIPETTEFVKEHYSTYQIPFILADAGNAFEKYVLRKGFFGRGHKAHEHAYHILKAGPLRKAISKHIRQKKRGRKILLLNGARLDESDRRTNTKPGVMNPDYGAENNIWVNLIHHFSREQRDQFLLDCGAEINPVTKKMCRSGECLCGTMQAPEVRYEASALYPHWGAWLKELEQRVMKIFPWGWGQDVPKYVTDYKRGQSDFFYMPMCVGCSRDYESAPTQADNAGGE